MVYEKKHPKDIEGVISFTSVYSGKKKYDLHGSYVGQVIKQIAGEGVGLYTTIRLDEAIEMAIALDIRIISASRNGTKTTRNEELLKKYYDWGGIFIAAAGNDEGDDVDFPASSPYTIAVSATNTRDCDGLEIDVTADAWWDVVRPPGITFDSFDGTSCSCPVIAGCVALILEKHPEWQTEEVRQFLRENSAPGDEEFERVFSFPDDFGKVVEEVKKSYIVIHHSTTKDNVTLKDFDAIRRYHVEVNGWKDIGYHWIVEQVNGKLQAVSGRTENTMGAHCKEGNMNSKGIGVCMVGNFEENMPSDELYTFVADLCKDIMKRHGIPVENVIGHRDVMATACPGKNFDLDKLRNLINESEKEGDSVEDWMKEMGEEAVDYLVKEGIIKNPEYWKPKLSENVPNWLFFALLKRLDEGGK